MEENIYTILYSTLILMMIVLCAPFLFVAYLVSVMDDDMDSNVDSAFKVIEDLLF